MQMKKEQSVNITREDSKNKQDNGISDFLQLLQNNGMFVDCVSPVKEAMEEIEKQLKQLEK